MQLKKEPLSGQNNNHFNRLYLPEPLRKSFDMEGWLSPVEGTRLEIERRIKPTVGSNPTPSAKSFHAYV